jgi:hypothetical protein
LPQFLFSSGEEERVDWAITCPSSGKTTVMEVSTVRGFEGFVQQQ